MIRGRTTGDGAVEFYDSVTGDVVFAIDADGTAGGSVAWDDVTGKPATFPPTIGTTATTAKAGNYAPSAADVSDATTVGRSVLTAASAAAARTAIGAGTSSLTLGTSGTTACAGNDARLLTGSAAAVNNSTATDVAGLVADFNALLAALRTRGVITGA